MVSFARARAVADALLYEGYLLYPYRASAPKNRFRWQFGVLAPKPWSEGGGSESWWMQTECLVETAGHARLTGRLRFLQIERRSVEEAADESSFSFRRVESLDVDGRLSTSFEEGVEREWDFDDDLPPDGDRVEKILPFAFPHAHTVEPIHSTDGRVAGRIVRERWPIEGAVRISTMHAPAPFPLLRIRIRVENRSPSGAAGLPREEALPSFFVGAHLLLAITAGSFVSLTDPPQWARPAASGCESVRSWPVLVGDHGDRSTILCSPIILDDHPQIAPESPHDLCDATEIDEILTLRTLTLTDAEKREARATDPRAAATLDRIEAMPAETLERLHGTVRARPEIDTIEIEGIRIGRGSRVRLRPGRRRTDAQDVFLAGRVGRVEAVLSDVDDRRYLAVMVEDDPAADLNRWHGRYLYFAPDEVQPLERHP